MSAHLLPLFTSIMARLGPWPASRRVAVAVSGGADSMSLAFLTRAWGHPLALIVDHRLRPESTLEAQQTATSLASLGIPSRVLTLHNLKPGPGLAARARTARYTALTHAAREAGLSDLLLGHHAADQAETLLLRAEARSGPAGLAGMAAITETADLRLVRPLLGVPPGHLRALLRAENIAWAEDPSNRNPQASRTRMRESLGDPEGEGDATQNLLAAAARNGRARALEEQQTAQILGARAKIFPEGYARLSPGPLTPKCLAALIQALTGAPYPPRTAALARLAGGAMVGTLGGIRLMPNGQGTLLVREEAAMQPPMLARPGRIWDGRFRLEWPGALPPTAEIGALGADSSRFRDRSALPSAVLRTLPAIRDASGLVAVPHAGYFKGWTNPQLRLTLHSALPLAGAPFEVFWAGDAQTAREHHVPA
jgi:tRNA(Ile)-lysidine synthase